MTPTETLLNLVAAKLGKPAWEIWPGWYDTENLRHIPCCGTKWHVRGTCEKCGMPMNREPSFIGPNLYNKKNLHLLFEVADVVLDPSGYHWMAKLVDMVDDQRTFGIGRRGHALFAHGPTRTAALAAAIVAVCGGEGQP